MNRRAPKRPRRRAHDCVVMSTDELVARVGSFIREFSVLRALAATSKAGQRAAGAEALRRVLLRRPSAAAILAPTAYTGDPIAMAHTSAPIAALRAFGGRGPRRLPSRTPRFEIGAYTLLVDVYFKDMQTNSWRTIFSTATTLQELFSAVIVSILPETDHFTAVHPVSFDVKHCMSRFNNTNVPSVIFDLISILTVADPLTRSILPR